MFRLTDSYHLHKGKYNFETQRTVMQKITLPNQKVLIFFHEHNMFLYF